MDAVIIASGPSLTKDQVDYCKDKAFTAVINNSYQIAPWADLLYACDEEWWDYYRPDFKGLKYTINESAAAKYNLNLIKHDNKIRFSTDKDVIATNGNSGFQAINLIYHFGYRNIYLLGFDYKNTSQHWHGRHPGAMDKFPNMNIWVHKMIEAKPLMDAAGLKIINCSPDSAIQCFEKRSIFQCL